MKKGILVTIMGVTNMGKTTQIELLKDSLSKKDISFTMLKYPIYALEPTGPRMLAFLKGGNPEKLTPAQFQELCAQNRKDFEPQLKELLLKNDVVIAEMYTGTGIAYGFGDGVPLEYLMEINDGIMDPDVSILLDGSRYKESIEETHVYENDDEKTERIRQIHLSLAKELNWHIINANLTREVIQTLILEIIIKELKTNA